MTANTPASRKAKGRRLQQAVREDLVERVRETLAQREEDAPDRVPLRRGGKA